MYAAIMAGGEGTRLWPASRDTCPKQFLNVLGGEALVVPYSPRPFVQPSLASERFLDDATSWLRNAAHALAPFAHPRGPIVAAILQTKPDLFGRRGAYDGDYHPDALARYHTWLEARYGNALPPGYPSASAADIKPPRRFDATRDDELIWHIDWLAFGESLVVDAVERFTATLRASGLDAITILHRQLAGNTAAGDDAPLGAIAAHADLLESFGGHVLAGGLRIAAEKVADFAEAFTSYARARLDPEMLVPALSIDAEATLAELSYPVVEHLERLAPFGQGNPRPVVAVRDVRLLREPLRMGRGGEAVSFIVGQDAPSSAGTARSVRMRCVGFGMGYLAEELIGTNLVDIAGRPVLNRFNGRTSVEMHLCDVRRR